MHTAAGLWHLPVHKAHVQVHRNMCHLCQKEEQVSLFTQSFWKDLAGLKILVTSFREGNLGIRVGVGEP